MSTDKDLRIQQMLESNTTPNDPADKDAEAYTQVFNALKTDLKQGFSMSFTANILQKIRAKESRKFLYWTYALFALMLMLGLVAFLFSGMMENIGVLAVSVAEHKWMVLFFIGVLVVVQFSGKRRGLGVRE